MPIMVKQPDGSLVEYKLESELAESEQTMKPGDRFGGDVVLQVAPREEQELADIYDFDPFADPDPLETLEVGDDVFYVQPETPMYPRKKCAAKVTEVEDKENGIVDLFVIGKHSTSHKFSVQHGLDDYQWHYWWEHEEEEDAAEGDTREDSPEGTSVQGY